MFNNLIRISYDGTNYSGFQIQDNAITVQEKLERALKAIYKEPIRITGAGRTDSGVHARGQAANFKAPFPIAPEKLPHALNALLPSDLVINGSKEVEEDFHARFDARSKLYSYTIDRAPFPQVMKRLYSWHVSEKLNLDIMEEAARLFEGTHDFKIFQAAGSKVVKTERTLYRLEVSELPREQLLVLNFEGSGFLYRMIRLITGTLIRAGKGRLSLSEINRALNCIDNVAAGPSAPPWGLCLEQIKYDCDH